MIHGTLDFIPVTWSS